ncbi:Stf0 family sulfotransferase [Mesorhizobium cantuariense]|uniref:Stf0 family sulfotransferase n=1 Tax=Mesorhizobium cantuariense TaxID=1300275 RepID=A0ABV7MPW7_9HYPH
MLPNLRFILLSRRDLLGQAISWARALQTSQYRSTQTASQEPVFHAELVQKQLDALVRERARWEMFFARTGMDPLRLEYETIVANPPHAVRQVADMMGVTLQRNPESISVAIQQQRDSTSFEWAVRFRSERGNPNTLDSV